eukprot:1394616-Pyramimonas_sp.AAC.1
MFGLDARLQAERMVPACPDASHFRDPRFTATQFCPCLGYVYRKGLRLPGRRHAASHKATPPRASAAAPPR